eukprot:356930-Chlamydomonas_euryale.AAC.7
MPALSVAWQRDAQGCAFAPPPAPIATPAFVVGHARGWAYRPPALIISRLFLGFFVQRAAHCNKGHAIAYKMSHPIPRTSGDRECWLTNSQAGPGELTFPLGWFEPAQRTRLWTTL